MLSGNLRVRPISAQFQQKKEIFDKADPYCKISIGNQVEKTDVCKNQSTNPSWNNTFAFNNVNLSSAILRFDIYDKNVLLDTSLGSAEVALNNLTQINNRFNGWIQLFHHNEVCGSLLIELEFSPMQSNLKTMDTGFQSYQPVYQSVSTTGGIPTTYSGEQQLGGFNQGYQQGTGGLGGTEQLYGQQGYQQSGQYLSGQGYSQGLSSGGNLGSGMSSGGYGGSTLGTTGGSYGQGGSLSSGTMGYSGQQLGQQFGQQVGQGYSSGGLSGVSGTSGVSGLTGQPTSYGQSMGQQLGSKVQQAGTSLGQTVSHLGQGSGTGTTGGFGTGYSQYKQ